MNEQQTDYKSFLLIHRKTLTDIGNQIVAEYDDEKCVKKSELSELTVQSNSELKDSHLSYGHFYSKFGPRTEAATNYPKKSCLIKTNTGNANVKTTILAYGDTLDYDVTSIDSKDIYATNDVNRISNFRFARHSTITAFVGLNLTYIESDVFIKSKLIYVELDGIQQLPTSCFADCMSLEYISLGSKLLTVPAYCFSNCNKLVYIELPETCRLIEPAAFVNCSNLRMIDGIEHVRGIGERALEGTSVRYVEIGSEFEVQKNITGTIKRNNIEAIVINNVTTVETGFIEECSKLQTVIVGPNVGNVQILTRGTEKLKEIIFEGTSTSIHNSLVEGYSYLNYVHHSKDDTIQSASSPYYLPYQLCGSTISLRYYALPYNVSQTARELLDNISRLEFLSVNTINGFDTLYLPNSVKNIRIRKGECTNEDSYMNMINSQNFGPRIHYY